MNGHQGSEKAAQSPNLATSSKRFQTEAGYKKPGASGKITDFYVFAVTECFEKKQAANTD